MFQNNNNNNNNNANIFGGQNNTSFLNNNNQNMGTNNAYNMGNTFNMGNNNMGMNMQNNYQQPNNFYSIEEQKKLYQKGELTQQLETIEFFFKREFLGNILQKIPAQHQAMIKTIENCTNTSEKIMTKSQAFMKANRQRCLKLKEKNQKLIQKTLNVRQKLVRVMYMFQQKNNQKDAEYNQTLQQIRKLKVQISSKINDVKTAKYQNKQNLQPQTKYTVDTNIPLKQLKLATEFLQIQTIKAGSELRTFQHFLATQPR